MNYTPEEVKRIVDGHRDGETLEDFEKRMTRGFIEHCKRSGKDPVEEVLKCMKSL